MSNLRVGDGQTSGFDAVEEIAHVIHGAVILLNVILHKIVTFFEQRW